MGESVSSILTSGSKLKGEDMGLFLGGVVMGLFIALAIYGIVASPGDM